MVALLRRAIAPSTLVVRERPRLREPASGSCGQDHKTIAHTFKYSTRRPRGSRPRAREGAARFTDVDTLISLWTLPCFPQR
jgi:hypothetical protein